VHVPHAYTIIDRRYLSIILELKYSIDQSPSTISKHQNNHTKNASMLHHIMSNSKHKDNIYPYQNLCSRYESIECWSGTSNFKNLSTSFTQVFMSFFQMYATFWCTSRVCTLPSFYHPAYLCYLFTASPHMLHKSRVFWTSETFTIKPQTYRTSDAFMSTCNESFTIINIQYPQEIHT